MEPPGKKRFPKDIHVGTSSQFWSIHGVSRSKCPTYKVVPPNCKLVFFNPIFPLTMDFICHKPYLIYTYINNLYNYIYIEFCIVITRHYPAKIYPAHPSPHVLDVACVAFCFTCHGHGSWPRWGGHAADVRQPRSEWLEPKMLKKHVSSVHWYSSLGCHGHQRSWSSLDISAVQKWTWPQTMQASWWNVTDSTQPEKHHEGWTGLEIVKMLWTLYWTVNNWDKRHHCAWLGTLWEQTEKILKKETPMTPRSPVFLSRPAPPPPRAGPKVCCSGLPAGFVLRTKAAVPPIIKVSLAHEGHIISAPGPAQVKVTCSQPAPEMDLSRPQSTSFCTLTLPMHCRPGKR